MILWEEFFRTWYAPVAVAAALAVLGVEIAPARVIDELRSTVSRAEVHSLVRTAALFALADLASRTVSVQVFRELLRLDIGGMWPEPMPCPDAVCDGYLQATGANVWPAAPSNLPHGFVEWWPELRFWGRSAVYRGVDPSARALALLLRDAANRLPENVVADAVAAAMTDPVPTVQRTALGLLAVMERVVPHEAVLRGIANALESKDAGILELALDAAAKVLGGPGTELVAIAVGKLLLPEANGLGARAWDVLELYYRKTGLWALERPKESAATP